VLPSAVTASARGLSPNSEMISRWLPTRSLPRLVASNTHTSAPFMPLQLGGSGGFCGVPTQASGSSSDLGFSGWFWPRRAALTKARGNGSPGWGGSPPNTTSQASSPTSSVRITRGGTRPVSTMLTLSDRWLTTHSSVSVRKFTATGSSPTGTEASGCSPPPLTENSSTRLSGTLVTASVEASGESATGRTGTVSKFT
jgi:hypothetical protein